MEAICGDQFYHKLLPSLGKTARKKSCFDDVFKAYMPVEKLYMIKPQTTEPGRQRIELSSGCVTVGLAVVGRFSMIAKFILLVNICLSIYWRVFK